MSDPSDPIATTLAADEKYRAEADLARARVETERLVAAQSRILLARTMRDEETDLARDHFHRRLVVQGQIDEKWARIAISTITDWMRNDPGCDMELTFYSSGGSTVDGFAIWDGIQMARREGHKVVTSVLGNAFSMAAVLLQAGDIRRAYGQSWIMLHEPSFGAAGKLSSVQDTADWVKAVNERILGIFAARSHLSKTQIKNRCDRTEWFISPEEALKFGLVDEVL